MFQLLILQTQLFEFGWSYSGKSMPKRLSVKVLSSYPAPWYSLSQKQQLPAFLTTNIQYLLNQINPMICECKPEPKSGFL